EEGAGERVAGAGRIDQRVRPAGGQVRVAAPLVHRASVRAAGDDVEGEAESAIDLCRVHVQRTAEVVRLGPVEEQDVDLAQERLQLRPRIVEDLRSGRV